MTFLSSFRKHYVVSIKRTVSVEHRKINLVDSVAPKNYERHNGIFSPVQKYF